MRWRLVLTVRDRQMEPQTQVNNGEEMDRCQGHACVVYSQSLNSKNLNTFVYII